jgi:hypothetical protein
MTMHRISSYEKVRGVRRTLKIRREGARDESDRRRRSRIRRVWAQCGGHGTQQALGEIFGGRRQEQKVENGGVKMEHRRHGGTAILRTLLNHLLRACCIGRRKVKS